VCARVFEALLNESNCIIKPGEEFDIKFKVAGTSVKEAFYHLPGGWLT